MIAQQIDVLESCGEREPVKNQTTMANHASFQINDRVIHPALGSVEGPRGTLRLEPRVMDLLRYLADSGGRVISREDIIRDVWRGTLVTDDVITRSISQIRRALADDWRKTPVIETIPKRGYRLLHSVQEIAPETPSADVKRSPAALAGGAPRDSAQVSSVNSTRRHISPRFVFASALAVAILIGAEVFYHRPDAVPGVTAPPKITSVMIAPFVRTDVDSPGDYLGPELSAELIDALAASSDLRVIGAGSSSASVESAKSALQAARELKVSALITGTLQQTATQLLLSISMLDPSSGNILHGHDYQFPRTAALAASESVAIDVAHMLGVTSKLPRQALEPPTTSPEAYQLFLEARHYLARNETGAVQQGIDFLRQAVTIDPGFAEAHAALGIAEMLQVDFGNRPVMEVSPRAQREVDLAFSLRPKFAPAYAAQGLIYMYAGRSSEAADSLRQAIALRPNYAQAHMWLGLVAQAQWRMQSSVASFEHALEIEPLSAIANLNLSRALDLSGFYDRAEREVRRGIAAHQEFANLHWVLGHILWNKGQLVDAHAEYQRAVDNGVNFSALYGQMALLTIDMGLTDKAGEWVLRGERIEPHEDMIWLARLMNLLAARRFDRLPREMTATNQVLSAAPYAQAGLATLDFYRRDFASAHHRFSQLLLDKSTDDHLLHSRWLTVAGHAPALDAAAASILAGNVAEGRLMLTQLAAFMADLRRNGVDSPGMDYEDAAIAALSGDSDVAAMRLKSARLRGWREDWFVTLDPKMARLLSP